MEMMLVTGCSQAVALSVLGTIDCCTLLGPSHEYLGRQPEATMTCPTKVFPTRDGLTLDMSRGLEPHGVAGWIAASKQAKAKPATRTLLSTYSGLCVSLAKLSVWSILLGMMKTRYYYWTCPPGCPAVTSPDAVSTVRACVRALSY